MTSLSALDQEHKIVVNNDMIGRHLRHLKSDSLSEHVWEVTQVMSFLEHMRAMDPTGVYTLKLKLADPVQWGLTDVPPEQLEGLYELVKVTMIPSAHLHFYENSSRIATIDAAHMRGRLKCSYQGLVMVDSDGQNFNIS